MVRCSCGKPNCKISINFENDPPALWFTDNKGEQTLMYLDPNTIKVLVEKLREVLNYTVFEKKPF